MAASRSTRVTRSTVGINGLDENFCGRTLRNRSIAHQDEIPSLPLVRSRSPKKRPEAVSTTKGNNGGKSTDLKHQSPPDSWASPRKRGLSTSEKDSVEKDTVENSEAKDDDVGSPVLKRLKRCLRSDTLNGSEEEALVSADQEASERKGPVSDRDADSPGAKRTRRCLLLDDCSEREIKNVTVSEDALNDSALIDSKEIACYETVNGTDEVEVDSLNCDCSSENTTVGLTVGPCLTNETTLAENGNLCPRSSPLRNSSREDTVSDHNVPCTSSQEQSELEQHKLANDCPPCEHVTRADEPAPAPSTDRHLSVRDSEEEVDVVGDSGGSNEQYTQNSNLNKDHACAPFSGEPDSPSYQDTVSNQITCSSTHEEHGYTRKGSPSRFVPPKVSPHRSSSPCRENGDIEDIKASVTDSNVAGAVDGTDSSNSVAVTEANKGSCCDPVEHVDDELSKPPMEAKLTDGVPPMTESGSLQLAEEEEEDPDVYYFESDHVALKHNKEYV